MTAFLKKYPSPDQEISKYSNPESKNKQKAVSSKIHREDIDYIHSFPVELS
jgi:hypothetical protein